MRSFTPSGLEVILALSVVVALVPGPVRAQVVPQQLLVPLQPNERVRGTTADGIRFNGVLQSLDDVGLDIRLRGDLAATHFRFSGVEQLEVQRGTRRSQGRGAVKGLLIGAGIGILAGGISGSTSSDPYICGGGCGSELAIVGGVGLGVVGLLVGAILGSSVGDWVSVPLGPR
jgi:hypothetical protein